MPGLEQAHCRHATAAPAGRAGMATASPRDRGGAAGCTCSTSTCAEPSAQTVRSRSPAAPRGPTAPAGPRHRPPRHNRAPAHAAGRAPPAVAPPPAQLRLALLLAMHGAHQPRAELRAARVPRWPRPGAAPGAGARRSSPASAAAAPSARAGPPRRRASVSSRCACVSVDCRTRRGSSCGQRIEPRQRLGPGRCRQLRRRGRRGRAQVGRQVGQRDVAFMADAADHRDRRLDDGAHQRLVVEGPQVFERAAAAHQQQGVDLAPRRGQAQRRHQRGRRIGALHRAGVDDHPHLRRTPRQRRQHIVQRRRGRGGDDAQRRRPGGDRALARGVEQPGRLEPRLEAQELLVQRAGPQALHRLDHQLQLAARLVDQRGARAARPAGRPGPRSRAAPRRGGTSRSAAARWRPAMSFSAK